MAAHLQTAAPALYSAWPSVLQAALSSVLSACSVFCCFASFRPRRLLHTASFDTHSARKQRHIDHVCTMEAYRRSERCQEARGKVEKRSSESKSQNDNFFSLLLLTRCSPLPLARFAALLQYADHAALRSLLTRCPESRWQDPLAVSCQCTCFPSPPSPLHLLVLLVLLPLSQLCAW